MEERIRFKRAAVIMTASDLVNRELMTIQELTGMVKRVALAKWGYKAKEKLKELGLVTDKDIDDYLRECSWMNHIEDPDPKCKDYYNVEIITDISEKDMIDAIDNIKPHVGLW